MVPIARNPFHLKSRLPLESQQNLETRAVLFMGFTLLVLNRAERSLA